MVMPDGSRKIIAKLEEMEIHTSIAPYSKEEKTKAEHSPNENIEGSLEIHLENPYLTYLSLLYGFKVTNNWLKMHGGIMSRNKGRRKRKPEGKRNKRTRKKR